MEGEEEEEIVIPTLRWCSSFHLLLFTVRVWLADFPTTTKNSPQEERETSTSLYPQASVSAFRCTADWGNFGRLRCQEDPGMMLTLPQSVDMGASLSVVLGSKRAEEKSGRHVQSTKWAIKKSFLSLHWTLFSPHSLQKDTRKKSPVFWCFMVERQHTQGIISCLAKNGLVKIWIMEFPWDSDRWSDPTNQSQDGKSFR